jgi:hypothetical protein
MADWYVPFADPLDQWRNDRHKNPFEYFQLPQCSVVNGQRRFDIRSATEWSWSSDADYRIHNNHSCCGCVVGRFEDEKWDNKKSFLFYCTGIAVEYASIYGVAHVLRSLFLSREAPTCVNMGWHDCICVQTISRFIRVRLNGSERVSYCVPRLLSYGFSYQLGSKMCMRC